MKVWSIYITWFTWSLGSNALAISWIITSKQPVIQPVLRGVALVMMASLILACVGVYFVQRFLEKVPAQALLFSNPTAQNKGYLDVVFGAGLTRFVSGSMIVTFLLILVAWGFLIYYGADMFVSAAAHPGGN